MIVYHGFTDWAEAMEYAKRIARKMIVAQVGHTIAQVWPSGCYVEVAYEPPIELPLWEMMA